MKSKEVCVVHYDDELDERDLFARTLEPEGFCVFSAATPEEALTLVRECRPQVVVIDVMSATNLNEGLELLEQLSKEGLLVATKAILFSNKDDDKTKGRAESLGAEYVFKENFELCVERVRAHTAAGAR